jgi:tetratricopeptide (TPR) repeat protein
MSISTRARRLACVACVALLAGVLAPARVVRADPAMWQHVADPQRDQFERLVQKARDLLAEGLTPTGERGRTQLADRLATSEARLHEALALSPFDFSTLFLLAEVQSLRGHVSDAVATLERAEPLARLSGQKAACWFRLGLERSHLGRYREALASYEQQIALGESEAPAYANAAELLMGLGRLREAEERYREAIRIDEHAADRRGHEQGVAFSYYGLGVALDRDRQDAAAREAIGRAVAMDPTGALLRLAQQPGADFSFLPEGDVFYYLGLASELGGKTDDAVAAFQEFLSRQPKSPSVARARAHLTSLTLAPSSAPSSSSSSSPSPSSSRPRHRWRAVATATVSSQGPLAAPVIDAALKQRPPPWDECFGDAAPSRGHDTVRFFVEAELDARGNVTRATAHLPAPFDAGATGHCVEAALRSSLTVTPPAHAKPTIARIEVLLANGDSGGL